MAALISAAAASHTFASPAFGQSGGGATGRQGRPASGNDNGAITVSPSKHVVRPRPRTRELQKPKSSLVTGRWRWTAECPFVGELHGFVTLAQRSDHFSGAFGQTNSWDRGTITNGSLIGANVTFTRLIDGGTQDWSGTVFESDGRLHMHLLTQTSVGQCTVEALKL